MSTVSIPIPTPIVVPIPTPIVVPIPIPIPVPVVISVPASIALVLPIASALALAKLLESAVAPALGFQPAASPRPLLFLLIIPLSVVPPPLLALRLPLLPPLLPLPAE